MPTSISSLMIENFRNKYLLEMSLIKSFAPFGSKETNILHMLTDSISKVIIYGIALRDRVDFELISSWASEYFETTVAEKNMSTYDLSEKYFWAYFSKWMLSGIKDEQKLRFCLKCQLAVERELGKGASFADKIVLSKVFLGEVDSAKLDIATKRSSYLWQCLNAQRLNDNSLFQKEKASYLLYLKRCRRTSRIDWLTWEWFPYYVAYTHLFGEENSFQDTMDLMYGGKNAKPATVRTLLPYSNYQPFS